MRIDSHDDHFVERFIEVGRNHDLIFQVEEDHPSTAHRPLVFDLMMVEAPFAGIVNAAHIADVIAPGENLRVARPVNLISVDPVEQEQQGASRHFVSVE